MADFDKPAFSWESIGKNMNSVEVQRDELSFPGLTINPGPFYNAFGASGAGGEVNPNELGYPIVG